MSEGVRGRLAFAWYCIQHRLSLRAQERYQAARLKRLVAHAMTSIPFIKKHYGDCGITPGSIRSVQDLQKLPILNKATFIGKPTEEYIDNSRMVNSRWYITSGTSGTPFRFLMSEISINDAYSDFATFRFLWWRGEPVSRLSLINIARIKIRSVSGLHRLFVPVEAYLNDPHAVIRRLQHFKTEIIYAYPSILLDLSNALAETHETLPDLRFALSFGEKLTPASRARITERLGCEVYDRYGLEEIGVVGVECVEHDGFHINSESVIIEIVDDEGRACGDGEAGRVIATDLWNYGMPFIRYDTGDRGVISRAPCACGLRSPRIWIQGRFSAYLEFPSRRIHHLEFDGAMDGFMNAIYRYQIAKISDTEIRARIIPGPAFDASIEAQVRANLSSLVGPTIEVTVESVEVLPMTERGKSRIVIDESPQVVYERTY